MANPPYRIIIIDPPKGVTTIQSIAVPYMGINNRGEACGTFDVDGSKLPFVWLPASNSTYADLSSPGTHALPLDPERENHQAREINVNGFVVGRAAVGEIGTSAYLWNLQAGTEGVIFLFQLNHKDEAFDINDAVPPVVVGNAFVPPDSLTYGYRKIVYGAVEALDYLVPSHIFGQAYSISDSGFVAGFSQGVAPQFCGEQTDGFRAVSYEENFTGADNLATLGPPLAEAVTYPVDVNNASPSMIVGYGDDPDDVLVPCRDRALFWEDGFSEPIALPFLVVNGQPVLDDMRADAIGDPFPNGRLEAVGQSANVLAAVLWRRVNNVWEAINLNDVISCGGEEWANVSHALDINDCGWIVGHGTLTDGSPRGFILVPADACPGDISGDLVMYPDGKVDINDLTTVILNWGVDNCIADVAPIGGDNTVNIDDLTTVILNWGACACFPAQSAPLSLSAVIADAGLTQAKWNEFLDVMANGTAKERENYACWWQRRVSHCEVCPSCPSGDPFEE